MLRKFLKDVVVLVVGKQAEEIADLLNSNKHVNEFSIAKKLGITINQTRNILYKISDHGLVSSIRKKDKRKGWYTYFWKIEILKALEFLRGILLKKLEQISNQIKSRESKQFYVCELCNVEFNEESALIHDFTCQECGNVFVIKDNTSVLRELKKNFVKLQKELDIVDQEIEKERAKSDKKRVGEIKKELKKEAKTRIAKKLIKKKLAEKAVKKKGKTIKKTSKKKLVKKPFKKKMIKKKSKPVSKKKSAKKKAVKKKSAKKKKRK
ncbi:MAG: hypothetical protein ABIH59_03560 [archaeon]